MATGAFKTHSLQFTYTMYGVLVYPSKIYSQGHEWP